MPRARKELEQKAVKPKDKKISQKITTAQVRRGRVKKEAMAEEATASQKFYPPKINRKAVMGFLTVAGVLVLLFLLGRYLVVAWVDNKPVTRFEYYNELDKRFGTDVKNGLIVEKLIISEAQKRGISVNPAEIDSEIKKLEDQQQGAQNLDQLLAINNLTRDDLRGLIRRQLITEKIFSEGVAVTDEEVNKYIDDNQEIYSTPSGQISDDIKNGVREQIRQQKINENYNNWITETLDSPRVSRM